MIHLHVIWPYPVTPCKLGNFSCFCCCLLTISKLTFAKDSFRNTIRVSNNLEANQDVHSVGPDLGPHLFAQVISTASKERVQ